MTPSIHVQILAEILTDNQGQRLTHAMCTGLVASFAQALASIPPDVSTEPPLAADQPSAAESKAA